MKHKLILAAIGLLSSLVIGFTSGFDTMAFQMGIATALVFAISPFLPKVELPFEYAGCDDVAIWLATSSS